MRSNFGNVLLLTHLRRSLTKPLLGKPWIRYGQVLGVSGYLFTASGMLASRFCNSLVPFVSAYVSTEEGAETASHYLVSELFPTLNFSEAKSSGIANYSMQKESERVGLKDKPELLLKILADKLSQEQALETIAVYMYEGTALGLCDPKLFRELYDWPLTNFDRENWDQARAAGLDIPESPDQVPFEELQNDLVQMFTEYCAEFCPNEGRELGLLS